MMASRAAQSPQTRELEGEAQGRPEGHPSGERSLLRLRSKENFICKLRAKDRPFTLGTPQPSSQAQAC